MRKISFIILLAAITVIFSSCKKDITPLSKTDFFMGTVVTITLYDKRDEDLINRAFKEIERYETLLSRNIEGSDVYNINKNAGSLQTQISHETLENIIGGLYYHNLSEGFFDITIGPLVSLWDIGGKNERIPSQAEIDNTLTLIDISKINISENNIILEETGMQIDLGGIAKGYIADKISEFLKANGCKSAIINLGGNILTVGKKPNGEKWRIGIQNPFSRKGEYFAVLHVDEKSVVTSGIYERYFIENDVLYHHILDPFTGYPVVSNLSGVTIVSNKSIDGDALSTTVFSLGLDEGIALIESLENTEAVFITKDNEIHYSSGIGTKIKIELIN